MRNLKNVVAVISLSLSGLTFGTGASLSEGAGHSAGSFSGPGTSKCAKALMDYKRWSRQFDLEGEGVKLPFLASKKAFVTGEKFTTFDQNGNKSRAIVLHETTKDFPHKVKSYSFPIAKGPTVMRIKINGEVLEVHSNNGCSTMIKASEGSGKDNLLCKIENSKEVKYTSFDSNSSEHFENDLSREGDFSNDHFLRMNLAEIAKNFKKIKEKGLIDISKKPLRERNFRACATSGHITGRDLVSDFNSMFPHNPILNNSDSNINRRIGSSTKQ